MCSLIGIFASRLNILWVQAADWTSFGVSKLKGGCTDSSESTLVKMTHCWKSHVTARMLWTLERSFSMSVSTTFYLFPSDYKMVKTYLQGIFCPSLRGQILAPFPIENSHLFSPMPCLFFPIKKSKKQNFFFFLLFLETTTIVRFY